jgi:tetratricopeptide (TPR) repeat protein
MRDAQAGASISTGTKAHAARRRQTILLSVVMVLGLAAAASLNRWIETHRPPTDAAMEEEKLYVTGTAARRMSLSFNGLIADWYWMRSLQYVGRKVIAQGDRFQLDNLSSLDLKLLYPLLDTATTLDPQFIPVYEYGGVVLPAINVEDAVKLLKKGIQNNPSEWRLFHHLGYIYWQRGDYRLASETYGAGARLANAPAWMQAMSARMLAEGGSRETAREIYTRIHEQTDDETIKRMAERHLMQLDSLDEREVIRKLLREYQARSGRCVSDWRDIAPRLRATRLRIDEATGAPLDPAGVPYVLVKESCDVDLDPGSEVPYK